jgi:hypothetical protein
MNNRSRYTASARFGPVFRKKKIFGSMQGAHEWVAWVVITRYSTSDRNMPMLRGKTAAAYAWNHPIKGYSCRQATYKIKIIIKWSNYFPCLLYWLAVLAIYIHAPRHTHAHTPGGRRQHPTSIGVSLCVPPSHRGPRGTNKHAKGSTCVLLDGGRLQLR